MPEGKRAKKRVATTTKADPNFQENVVDSTTDIGMKEEIAEEPTPVAVPAVPTAKGKRGRPKKDDVEPAAKTKGRAKKVTDEEPAAPEPEVVVPPKKRGRKKETVEVEETVVEEAKNEVKKEKKPKAANGRVKQLLKEELPESEEEVMPAKKNRKRKSPEPAAEVESEPKSKKKGRPSIEKTVPQEELTTEAKEPKKRGRAPKKHLNDDEVNDVLNDDDEEAGVEVVVKEPKKRGRAPKKVVQEEVSKEEEEESVKPVAKRGRKKKEEDKPAQKEEKAAIPKTATKGRKRVVKEEEEVENNGIVEEEIEKKTKPATKSRKRAAKEDEAVETNGEAGEEPDEKEKPTKVSKAKQPKLNSVTTDYSDIDFQLEKEFNLKICSWNVAGLRSWLTKGGLDYIAAEKPDIICLQETKCSDDQLPDTARMPGYHPYWLCPKGGYAGVALYSKIMPINVEYGIGDAEQDEDGRMMTAEYEKFYVVCVYVPNAGRKLVTLPKRLRWNKLFEEYVSNLDKKKPVIICGDMNVSHKEIDLANPKANQKNAGFTKEERAGMDDLLALGFVDSYRHFYPDTAKAYTFWTYMGNARGKDVGWRLDYGLVSERAVSKVVDNVIRKQVKGSDHCPIVLFVNW